MRMHEYEKKDGFSLVELIIAIAILTIFVGTVSLSFALLRNADTKGLASGINDSLTDLKARTESGNGPFYLHIYKIDDRGYYANISGDEDFDGTAADTSQDTRLGQASLNVASNGGDDPLELAGDGSNHITIQMRKKDGAYEICPDDIEVRNGDRIDFKVIMVKDTGLHYMEQQ